MSYEYKELIEQAIIDDDRPLDWEEGFKELDEVYAQAAKADEYEAKAEAFDHIENLVKTELTNDDLYNDARNNDYAAGMLRVYEMVDYIIDDYESGEMNVKEWRSGLLHQMHD